MSITVAVALFVIFIVAGLITKNGFVAWIVCAIALLAYAILAEWLHLIPLFV